MFNTTPRSTLAESAPSDATEGPLRNTLRDPVIRVNIYRELTFAADLDKDPAERRALDLVIDDVSLAPRPQGIDVIIASPHSSPLSDRPQSSASALDAAEKRNHGAYDDLCAAEAIEMRAAAVDIYSQLGREAQGVI